MPSSHASSRQVRWQQALLAGLGSMVAIALLAWVSVNPTSMALLMGSFGSSAVLVFGFPESGFSKPTRVVSAHVMCAALGLLCLHVLGDAWWVQGLSVGLAVSTMLGLRLVHPPAGSNPLLVFALQPDWTFLLWPTLLGSLSLVTLAWLWQRQFPKPNAHSLARP